MTRRRADVVLAERGLFPSREQARAAILAGEVRIAGRPLLKAGELIDEDERVEIASRPRFVSRGGEKLAWALEVFDLSVAGLSAIDVGASTGGFTDCLLQAGAATVVALDVGYGQLAWSLRTDDRVAVIERTNVRTVDPVEIGAPFDIVVCDVSFISLRTILPTLASLMGHESQMLVLVKPQFEVGKGRVGKRGVVREPTAHVEVLERVTMAVRDERLVVRGLTWSPIKGPEGNIEFWIHAAFAGRPTCSDLSDVVNAAHAALGG